jgi:Ca-activated chloride channel family protein
VLPTTFDFGTVTLPNTAAPLQVTISNTSSTPITVSGITLNVPSGPPYVLAVGGGVKPCGSATPTIAANDLCTVQVVFQPTTTGTFASTLQIASNASNAPTVTLPITGRGEQVISILNVRINQLDTSCSTVPNATAYVSVTDQAGFPVSNLTPANFLLTDASPPNPSLTINSVALVESGSAPVAMSTVMDHSGSLTDLPVAFADMKTGFTTLFADLRPGDLAEIVKFDDVVTVVQPFTSDKALLLAKTAEPYDMGRNTKLYDAVFKAVDDTAAQTTTTRRAVIVTTDGMDNLSTHTLTQTTNNAVTKKVPVFAIGLGASINRTILQEMTATTGGQYYEASTSQNLATIYDQLSSLLFQKQYVITFNHALKGTPNTPYQLNLSATLGSGGASGSATKATNSCN